ncbi:hypothetical protein [Streptomyces sp. NPDC012888]|uniref:virginiamycin B lyase family protein n=1 Tax=Streptomyces sp. NPDC012888 TaxID=3364855 RepID=UPI00367D976E
MTNTGARLLRTVPTPAGSGPYALTAGPDGNLWCTLVHSGRIARLTPGGEVDTFGLDAPGCRPSLITTGPDGARHEVGGCHRRRVGLLGGDHLRAAQYRGHGFGDPARVSVRHGGAHHDCPHPDGPFSRWPWRP